MIPKKIFQTWKTKNPDKNIQKAMSKIREMNPGYEYKLFDDQDCIAFLKENFSPKVEKAFKKVIPGAFKADLWRYAVLYKEGGVYIDADLLEYVPLDSIIHPQDSFLSVKDRDTTSPPFAVYQAFLASIPGHPVLKIALDLTVNNILTENEGTMFLDITGPAVLGRAVNRFLEKRDETPIHVGVLKSGEYGIRLLYHDTQKPLILDNKKELFHTKLDGYNPPDCYSCTKKYFHPDTREDYRNFNKSTNYILLFTLLFCSLIFILVFRLYS